MNIILFTDGAARGNPGPGGWAFVAITRTNETCTVFENAAAHNPTTNNEMELTAIIKGLEYILKQTEHLKKVEVTINLDSAYVKDGSTKWVKGWAKNGWLTKEGLPIKNKILWQTLHTLLPQLAATTVINWNLVKGHSGVPGNERCDVLATSCADKIPVSFYEGDIKNHPVGERLLIIPTVVKTYYLAYKNNIVMRFNTWDECRQWTSGGGARYKKVNSTFEENEVLKSWGL